MLVIKKTTAKKVGTGRKMDYEVVAEDTKDAVHQVINLLPKIERVTRVIHFRDSEEAAYETHILGVHGAIRVTDGLSSGFGGYGVKGLLEVLMACGAKKEKDVWDAISKPGKGIEKLDFEFGLDEDN